ncbi:hypothetical protein J2Y67_000101 [Neobacillus niacini]|nr:hypothetical protein [Neobacillus niacini]
MINVGLFGMHIFKNTMKPIITSDISDRILSKIFTSLSMNCLFIPRVYNKTFLKRCSLYLKYNILKELFQF